MVDSFTIVSSGTSVLGEGPAWIAREGALYWVDIMGRRLHRLALTDGAQRQWTMPEPIGWLVERTDRDSFLIGLASGIADLALDPFAIRPLVKPEPDRPHNRLNDAKVDSAGRLWFGSKDDRDREDSGALYRMDAAMAPVRVDDGYAVANGPAFSPDGRILYHTDSGRRTVYRFDMGGDGTIGVRRPFILFEEEWGYPDGMTTDAEGCLWIAHWGGGRISRFDPDGGLMRSHRLPALNVTSCAFAGDRLDRLFVTSASLQSPGGPADGALFEIEAGVRGLPPTPFAG